MAKQRAGERDATSAHQPCLILLVGRPGSGKSYLARLIAKRISACVVQNDAIRRQLFPTPTYNEAEHEAVCAEAQRKLAEKLERGRIAIHDATNLVAHFRDAMLSAAHKLKARTLVLAIAASEQTIRQRMARREVSRDAEDLSAATWDVFQKLGAYDPIPVPHLVLNSECDPQALAEFVARRVYGALSLSVRGR